MDTGSRQVDWWAVHQLVVPVLDSVGDWPLVGTPLWVVLDDHDPVKWAAVIDAGRHQALRWDSIGQANAQASQAVSTATKWRTVARDIGNHESRIRRIAS